MAIQCVVIQRYSVVSMKILFTISYSTQTSVKYLKLISMTGSIDVTIICA